MEIMSEIIKELHQKTLCENISNFKMRRNKKNINLTKNHINDDYLSSFLYTRLNPNSGPMP